MRPIPGYADRLAEREEMISEQLARRGIRSERVLEAMRAIPRERFFPKSLAASAYADAAYPIDCGQTISQPYMVGRMTELLALGPEERVLEIGTGSGYQTAILAFLAKEVFTIEWHLRLMTEAAERVRALGFENVTFRCADGSLGWPEKAPFDAIIVTAGAPDVPQPLVDQLAPGGRLVVPYGPNGDQTLALVRRTPEGIRHEDILKCRFVRLRGDAGWRD